MLDLNTLQEHAVFIGIAIVGGAFGGLIFELLQKRRGGATGAIENWSRGASFIDLGWGASVLVGIAAAVIVNYLLAPITVHTADDGAVTRTYDLIKLVGLSMLAGSAGPTIISSAQARLVAALESQRADTTQRVAEEGLSDVESTLKTPGSTDSTATSATAVSAARERLAAVRGALAALRVQR